MKWELEEIEALPQFIKNMPNKSWDEMAGQWNSLFPKNRSGESLRGKFNQLRWGWRPQKVSKASRKRKKPRKRSFMIKSSDLKLEGRISSLSLSPKSEELSSPSDDFTGDIDERHMLRSHECNGQFEPTGSIEEEKESSIPSSLDFPDGPVGLQESTREPMLSSSLMSFLVGLVILLQP
ncbi:uncharacterized protein N7484_006755 [Penicillium longicatenatum]|uniref:uncharacterized protein n=1 Tax=Penicillium longicatenatum TaxID=1561947 RepID=UPI0025492F8A|nr:uncharacterized protein N7484_006755 [Penicillium longicatenatum]KAJ5644248.1 hypothetical protein N7484_006755 [Penicillium longicatenatum]